MSKTMMPLKLIIVKDRNVAIYNYTALLRV